MLRMFISWNASFVAKYMLPEAVGKGDNSTVASGCQTARV